MPDSPWVGPTYPLKSRVASVARTINLVPVPNEPGNERTAWVFQDVAGLDAVTQLEPPQNVYTGILNHFDVADGANIVSEIGPELTYSSYLGSTSPTPKFGAQRGGTGETSYSTHGNVSVITLDANKSWRAEGWFYPTTAQVDFFGVSVGAYSYGLGRFTQYGDSSFVENHITILSAGGGRFGDPTWAATVNAWNHIGIQYNATTGVFSYFIGQAGNTTGHVAQQYATTLGLFGTGTTTAGVSIGGTSCFPDEFYFRNVADSALYAEGYTVPTGPWSAPQAPTGGGTIRGLWTHSSTLYAVEGAAFYSIDSAGQKVYLGALNSSAGPVDFASNLSQLVVNDGSYLYVYSPIGGAFKVVPYAGGDRIAFLAQRIIYLKRGTQVFGWSDLADATSLPALNFASAESSPDPLVSLVVQNSEIVLLGSQSIETYETNPGLSDDTSAFTRTSASIDYGCAAPFSAQKTANSTIFLSADERGQSMVLSMMGHQVKRISSRALEEKLEGLDVSQASAFVESRGSHSFYCLNVPNLDTTWVWDETFSQWHERASWVNGAWAQWQPTCHAFAYGKHYYGCGSVLAVSNVETHTYLGSPKRRQRIAPVISNPSRNRVFFAELEMVCEKGYGGTMGMRYSDDTGANWSGDKYLSLGALGRYDARVIQRRMGSGYDRVFDMWVTDAVPWNPIALNVVFQ